MILSSSPINTPIEIRHIKRHSCFLLFNVFLMLSLVLTACSASNSSGHAQATATSATTEITTPDTAGCPATNQTGKMLYAFSEKVEGKGVPSSQYSITAITDQGKKVWEQPVVTASPGTSYQGLAASNGALFYAFSGPDSNSSTGTISLAGSYDARDGHPLWQAQAPEGTQVLAVCNSLVYLIGKNAVQALAARDGSLVWQQSGRILPFQMSPRTVSHKALGRICK